MKYKFFRICIICSRLDQPGGIERAIVNTANLLQENGYEVMLLVLDTTSASFFPLHPQIAVYREALHFGITKKGNIISRKIDFLRHTHRLEETINSLKPDAVITTEYPFTITACLATEKTGIPVFAWEHHHFYHLQKNKFWRRLQKKFYPKAKSVICLNPGEAELFKSIGCKTDVIPNFIEQGQKAPLQSKTFITVGWLSKTKGIDLVPELAQKIFAGHPDWKWKIIGTGDEKEALVRSLRTENLSSHVQVIEPTTHDLTNDYLSASMYIMLSKFECFPMVLLEAMSHGIPCLAFDCPTGPKHIIKHGEDGLLIHQNNLEDMFMSICRLIEKENERRALGSNAYVNIDRFSPGKIFPLWEAILKR